jgi:hypothetical protein
MVLQACQIHVQVPFVVLTLTASQPSQNQFIHVHPLLFAMLEQGLVHLLELHIMQDLQ